MKVLINNNPFPLNESAEVWEPKDVWPANWISINEDTTKQHVVEFKLELNFDRAKKHRIHIAADERYKLYVNGERIGCGNERGDMHNWFFDSYDVDFKEGYNEIVALVWAAREFCPWAQVTNGLSFICASEETDVFSTGRADWKYALIEGVEFVPTQNIGTGVGGMERYNTKEYVKVWQNPVVQGQGIVKGTHVITEKVRYLRPAMLPAQMYKKICEHRFDVGARTKTKQILDLGDYYCSYPMLRSTGGKGTKIKVSIIESLIDAESGLKGQRDKVEGKKFFGNYDFFEIESDRVEIETLWWRAGRFVEVEIETGDEPIEVALGFHETRYPFEPKINCKDERLEAIFKMCLRSVQVCSHETFMDCPFYEQLMYVGDTRIQAMVTMKYSKDHRLVKKAIEMFYESMCNVTFLPNCAFPANEGKTIQGFCLWWIGIIYDYVQFNADSAFVKRMMTGARRVMDMYSLDETRDGLLRTPPGWDFVDWVSTPGSRWRNGGPDERGYGVQSIFNLMMVHTYETMAKLEDYLGEKDMCQRWNKKANALMKAIEKKFWSEERGVFTDDLDREKTSEHAQILALLCEHTSGKLKKRALEALVEGDFDSKTDIYFKYYLFIVAQMYEKPEIIQREMKMWYDMVDKGFSTTPEHNAPDTRSDCHAWGAFPVLFM